MNSNGILHCTIDHKGELRLWGSPAEARDKKEAGEVLVQISLTHHQMTAILRAEGMARQAVGKQ